MPEEVALYEQRDATAVITMNRPDKRNALNQELIRALTECFQRAGDDDGVRSVILTGAGKGFCAGLDLDEVADHQAQHAGRNMAEADSSALMTLFETIEFCPKPTIAAVNGAAVAGGAGLMSACDLIVANEAAKIGYPEVKRGLVAVIVMTYLCRQISDRAARYLLMSGELITGKEAERIGLVNWAVPGDAVMDRAMEIAIGLRECGPESVKLTKQLINELHQLHPEERHDWAIRWNADMRQQKEAIEGLAAFHEKRKPNWAE